MKGYEIIISSTTVQKASENGSWKIENGPCCTM